MSKRETYDEAKIRIFRELADVNVHVKPALKVPQAKLQGGYTLYFHKQSVYLEAHSLFVDIRGMSAKDLVQHALNCVSAGAWDLSYVN